MKKAFTLAFIAATAAGLAWGAGQSAGKITIQEMEAFSYVSLSHFGPYSDIPEVVVRLTEALLAQSIAPAGPIMVIFHNDPGTAKPAELQWEVAFPISEQADVNYPESAEAPEEITAESPAGVTLQKKQWTFTRVAVCVHTGSYEATQETIDEMMTWIKDNGYKAAGPVVERYTDVDEVTGNSENLKTEIWIPIQEAER